MSSFTNGLLFSHFNSFAAGVVKRKRLVVAIGSGNGLHIGVPAIPKGKQGPAYRSKDLLLPSYSRPQSII